MRTILAVMFIVVIALTAVVLRPVCVPISDAALAQFTEPIEQRTDRDLHVRVFQMRNGRWHQCKTWLSRQLFF